MQGMKNAYAARAFGGARQAIINWLAAFEQGGDASLDAKKRGRPMATTIAEKHRKQIVHSIRGKCSDQLRLPFALWTWEAVVELVKKVTGCRAQLLLRRSCSLRRRSWMTGVNYWMPGVGGVDCGRRSAQRGFGASFPKPASLLPLADHEQHVRGLQQCYPGLEVSGTQRPSVFQRQVAHPVFPRARDLGQRLQRQRNAGRATEKGTR